MKALNSNSAAAMRASSRREHYGEAIGSPSALEQVGVSISPQ